MAKDIHDYRILIVDDNEELRRMVGGFLKKEGYGEIYNAGDCAEARMALASVRPEFIILDINLPDGDGFSLMKEIKRDKKFSEIPVLFLSARDKDADRLLGLGLGADDYMVKPFLMKEHSLRIAMILKWTYKKAPEDAKEDEGIHVLGSHSVDFGAGTVTSPKGVETLTVKEIGILKKLSENRGKIVTFDNLCMAVWGDNYYTYENTVMVHMRRLREKVEDEPSKPRWIVTKRGIGYKLNNESEK